jgi:hypothetical protein
VKFSANENAANAGHGQQVITEIPRNGSGGRAVVNNFQSGGDGPAKGSNSGNGNVGWRQMEEIGDGEQIFANGSTEEGSPPTHIHWNVGQRQGSAADNSAAEAKVRRRGKFPQLKPVKRQVRSR